MKTTNNNKKVGNVIMNHKKILSLILIWVMLVSVALAFAPSVTADQPDLPDYDVAGFVYVDGVLTDGNNVEVTLSVPGENDITDISILSGAYKISFYAQEGQIANFSVLIGYNHFIPDPKNFTIDQPHSSPIYSFNNVNLSIDTSTTNPPNKPSLINPTPSGITVTSEVSTTLTVQVSDPDGDTMDIEFYNADNDVLIGSEIGVLNGNSASVTWSGLNSGTTYNWYAVASDSIEETASDIWSFVTQSAIFEDDDDDDDTSGDDDDDDTSGDDDDDVAGPPEGPIADANGPYFEILIEGVASVLFDGSGSSGLIESYDWDFGDGNISSGVSPVHNYDKIGNYTVILTVTGNGKISTDTTYALITDVFNNAPENLTIIGPGNGTINIEYNFTVQSVDKDNDTVQYNISWGDGTSTITDFYLNGSSVNLSHIWDVVGEYIIIVRSSDNKTESIIEHTIVITSSYNESEEIPDVEFNNAAWYALALGMSLVILLLLIFYFVRKKKNKE